MPTFSLPHAPPFLTERLQREWNAPLPLYVVESEASAPCLMPDTFSMPDRSTSELLRTL